MFCANYIVPDVSAGCGEFDETESVDLGLRFSSGLDVDVTPSAAVTPDVGYDLGLTDIAAESLDETDG